MTITKNDITAEVSHIGSLYEILGQREQIDDTCLLLIRADESTVLGADETEKSEVREYLARASFMSAVVSEDNDRSELSEAADMVITPQEAEDFAEKLFKDKTKKQIQEINSCFTAARTPAEEVLGTESRAFYRLMSEKNGGQLR
ncbi:hypothetical protein [Ruminococcus flavefaciens]|uniref:hypothetical protein n=1 Tax=Ruminococcus flavefaciens TaxID=1265 RepID=UPI00030B14E9|nr:hypothetical protein [Ruminococcus flavefaciens]